MSEGDSEGILEDMSVVQGLTNPEYREETVHCMENALTVRMWLKAEEITAP